MGTLDFELFKKALIVRFDGLINENARKTFKQSLGMKSSQSIADFSDMIEIAAVRIIKSKNREQADLPHSAGTRNIIITALDSSFDDKPNPSDPNDVVILKIQVKTLRDSWESQAHSEKIQLFLENVHHSFKSQLIAFGGGSNLTYQQLTDRANMIENALNKNRNEVKIIQECDQVHMKNQIQHLTEQVMAIQVNPRFKAPYPIFPATNYRGASGARGRPWQRRAGHNFRQTFRPRTFQPRNSMPARPANPANAICWTCNKMGHFQRSCPYNKQQVKVIAGGSQAPGNPNHDASASKDYGNIPSLLDLDPGLPYYQEQF